MLALIQNAFHNVVVPVLYFGLTPALFIALVRQGDYLGALILPLAMIYIVGFLAIHVGP